MKLLLASAFDSLNEELWRPTIYWANNPECAVAPPDYTKYYSSQEVSCQNGLLRLSASFAPISWCGHQINYRVGCVSLKRPLNRDCLIEVEARLPYSGMWAAIYLYGLEGKTPSEIDIMEQLNGKKDNFIINYHVEGKQNSKEFTIPNISDSFHTYKLWWYKKKLVFGFDNKILKTKRCRVKKITPNQCLIMNNAIRTSPTLTIFYIRQVKIWEI